MTPRAIVTALAGALVALGVVGAVRVHWLIGIYFAELGTVLLIFDFQPPHSMRLLT